MDQNLNDLAVDLAREAGERLVKLPDCRAVCVTFVGDEMPVGIIVYDRKQPEGLTAIQAIDRLAAHIHVLAGSMAAVGEKGQQSDARNHSSSVGEQGSPEAHTDPSSSTTDAAPDATS